MTWLQISSWKDEDMNISNRAYHLECTALSVFHTLLEDIFALNCFLSVSFSLFFVKFRSMKEASIAVAAANKCQRISVSYANILPGWKRTHFTAINVVFVGKLLHIGVPIMNLDITNFNYFFTSRFRRRFIKNSFVQSLVDGLKQKTWLHFEIKILVLALRLSKRW